MEHVGQLCASFLNIYWIKKGEKQETRQIPDVIAEWVVGHFLMRDCHFDFVTEFVNLWLRLVVTAWAEPADQMAASSPVELTEAEKAFLPFMTNNLYEKYHSVVVAHFPLRQTVGKRYTLYIMYM